MTIYPTWRRPIRNLVVVDPYYANVSLLLHFDGTNGSTTFVDSSGTPKTITPFGAASISSAQSKFGGTSGVFNGSNAYLRLPYSSAFDISSGDWTIETWFNANSFSSSVSLISKDTFGSNYDWGINIASATSIRLYTQGTAASLIATVPTMSTGVWYNVTFTRYNGTNGIYLNGILYASNTMSISNSSQSYITIGCGSWNNPNAFFNGCIDEMRFTKGVGRNQYNFIPSEAPFYSL